MKKEGIVLKYNGTSGIIKDKDNISYIFVKKNIMDSSNLKVNDKVLFNPEKRRTIDIDENIATFIRKINK